MTRTLTTLLTGALAASLAACGQTTTEDFAASLPDADGLTLEVTGGAAEGLAPSALVEATTPATVPASGDDLATVQARIRALNEALRLLVGKVAEVARAQGVPGVGEAMTYGPADRCVAFDDAGACLGSANLVLRVRRERFGAFSFGLAARPVGSTDDSAFKPVAVGWLVRGRAEHRGLGQLALNLRNLAQAQAAYRGDGFLLAGFANGPVAKAVHYRLVEFTPDAARLAPATAAFVGMKSAAGVTRVRVAARAELLDGPNGEELLFAHAGWLPGVGGRAFAVVTNWKQADRSVTPPVLAGQPHGDVPADPPYELNWAQHYYFGRACYAATGAGPELTYKEWFLCDRPERPAECVARYALALTPPAVEVGTGTWAGTCTLAGEPAELGMPTEAGQDPEHGGAEPGMGGAGMLAPMSPPADPTDVPPPAGPVAMPAM
jgi:hypothetical protein